MVTKVNRQTLINGYISKNVYSDDTTIYKYIWDKIPSERYCGPFLRLQGMINIHSLNHVTWFDASCDFTVLKINKQLQCLVTSLAAWPLFTTRTAEPCSKFPVAPL